MLRYLKGTAEFGLKFSNSAINIIKIINKVKKYINSNYIGDIFNKKSIINYVFFIN